jgi:hypothetical protein
MSDKVALLRLRSRFNKLSKERQAEILGMAKAFTYAQQTAPFDIQAMVQKITQEHRAQGGGEK